MKGLLVSIALLAAAQPSARLPEAEPQVQTPRQLDIGKMDASERTAQDLYEEGQTAFLAADYEEALDAFRAALHVTKELPSTAKVHKIRHALYWNLAKSHEKAYGINRNSKHLYKSLDLYTKYAEQAPEVGGLGDELDGWAAVARMTKKVEIYEQIQKNKSQNKSLDSFWGGKRTPAAPSAPGDGKKQRRLGVGLISAGSVVTATGVGLATYGSTLKPRAENIVNGITEGDSEHPAREEAGEFLRDEQRKGQALIGIGIASGLVGVTGIVVGALQYRKGKQYQYSLSPSVTPKTAGLVLSGRF